MGVTRPGIKQFEIPLGDYLQAGDLATFRAKLFEKKLAEASNPHQYPFDRSSALMKRHCYLCAHTHAGSPRPLVLGKKKSYTPYKYSLQTFGGGHTTVCKWRHPSTDRAALLASPQPVQQGTPCRKYGDSLVAWRQCKFHNRQNTAPPSLPLEHSQP